MKFPVVLRRQLEKEKANLVRKQEELAKLRKKISRLTLERDEARQKVRLGYANIAEGTGGPRKILATALRGKGIEIGALHKPLSVPDDVRVSYVDMVTREENIQRFPEIDPDAIVETDFVCDGEKLEIIENESQEFVIANHMLEHCINPLGALENFLRVLKPSGLLLMGLPDKRFTFDEKRPITPFEHIEDDYRTNRTLEDLSTYKEWTEMVDNSEDAAALHKDQANIHFHVWTQAEILELIIEVKRRLGFPLEIEWAAKCGGEFVLLLRKLPIDQITKGVPKTSWKSRYSQNSSSGQE